MDGTKDMDMHIKMECISEEDDDNKDEEGDEEMLNTEQFSDQDAVVEENFEADFPYDPQCEKDWQPLKNIKVEKNEPLEEELLLKDIDCNDPYSLFKIFYTDEIINMIVTETNKYAKQCIVAERKKTKKSIPAWTPVNETEINTYFGIMFIMSLVQLPNIDLYWSTNEMYSNTRIMKAMTRERFLLISKYLYFADCTEDSKDELYEIREIFEALIYTFKNTVYPGQNIAVDDNVVPYRGHLHFYQNKLGIKLNRLCLPGGYTYNMSVYTGNQTESLSRIIQTRDVVLKLTSNLLNEERIIYTDSFYSSVPLAQDLLQQKTYLCGAINIDRQYLPLEAKRKQAKGEIVTLENKKGVKFLKWTNRRAVCIITTCPHHTCKIVKSQKENYSKPDAVLDYNSARTGCDIAEQMDFTFLRNTGKWYCKVIFHILCKTAMINAMYINQKWGTTKYELLKFREIIIDRLIPTGEVLRAQLSVHVLLKEEGTSKKRKRCKECYKTISLTKGVKVATAQAKKVLTYCDNCVGKPTLCLNCFHKLHYLR